MKFTTLPPRDASRATLEPGTGFTRAGFTLIELLVVVSIIGLLTAILFPAFARARENVRRTACSSNLKQIGLGLLQYIQDYDETNTLHWYGTSSGASDATTNYKWMDAIFPYVKSEALFNCPGHSLPVTIGTSTFDKYKFRTDRNFGSYGINAAYYSAPIDGELTSPFHNRAVASWEAPSTTIYAMDTAARYDIGWPSGNPPIIGTTPRYLPSEYMMVERHLGTVAILYCDGHAKPQKMEALTKVGTSGRYSAFTVQRDPD